MRAGTKPVLFMSIRPAPSTIPHTQWALCYIKQPSVMGASVDIGGRAAMLCGVIQGEGDSCKS